MMQNALRSFENCVGQKEYAVQGVALARSTNVVFIRIKRFANGIDVKPVNNNLMI